MDIIIFCMNTDKRDRIIKRIKPNEYSFVLELNQRYVDVLIPMDREELEWLVETAALFEIIYVDNFPAGFIIAFREGLNDYDFKSYKWFEERYPKFLYIDRIVVADSYQNQGLGRVLYKRAFDYAKENEINILAAAITTEPYNNKSMLFHAGIGFHEVGNQCIRSNTVKISQQVMELISNENS
ncbi:hypothetical protein SAMN04487928_13429 [Butyrivibrio proteoclasticus]|uniref:N-acetyltransferase domain-containing protein n=2 Tax=Butyrivibrio proteoclasticus TaxID=43305 RepID=A0A1I5XLR4_9FIRM|nr:hypothetical protein SAMN04487928_13429 [Butyrivibrio proteoclasticus]